MCAEPNEPKPPHTFPETHACARASQRAASGSASSRRAAGHRDARANSSPLFARAVACRWSDRRDTPRGVARIGLWHLPAGAASRRRSARATARAVGGAPARRQLAGAAAEAAAAAWQAGGGSCRAAGWKHRCHRAANRAHRRAKAFDQRGAHRASDAGRAVKKLARVHALAARGTEASFRAIARGGGGHRRAPRVAPTYERRARAIAATAAPRLPADVREALQRGITVSRRRWSSSGAIFFDRSCSHPLPELGR